jgi:glycosyltransferase involved in cell wall biosynthesis
MRILFVLEHFYPYVGGAEQLFWVLSTSLAKAGHEVAVVTTLFREGLPEEEEIEGIQIYRVRCANRFLFSAMSLPMAYRLAGSYDIIHTTSYNAALPAWIAAKLRRKPVFITFHEVWGQLWWQLPFASFLQRLAFYSWEQLLLRLPFDRFIAVSDYTRRAFRQHGIPDRKSLRIYNGLEYEDFEDWKHQPPERFTYTYFGRLGMSKGLDLLLPAAAEMTNRHPDSRLRLIIPTYPEAMFQRIMGKLQELGLEEHVELRHNLSRDELFTEITQSSCVVIPSYSEGFCFVAAESVAMGVPIVSSQRGALAEVVGGRYIPVAQQSAAAWAEALNLAYEGYWQEKPVQRFTLEDSVRQYIELYQKITSVAP